MKKELIPIIAAYWGCECSYYPDRVASLDDVELGDLTRLANFKLHLRPLFSITEDELKELGKVLDLDRIEVRINLGTYCETKVVKELSYSDDAFLVDNYGYYKITTSNPALAINYLRSKGFCLDQCLIDAELIQWKTN
jgi:hypothetical protein